MGLLYFNMTLFRSLQPQSLITHSALCVRRLPAHFITTVTSWPSWWLNLISPAQCGVSLVSSRLCLLIFHPGGDVHKFTGRWIVSLILLSMIWTNNINIYIYIQHVMLFFYSLKHICTIAKCFVNDLWLLGKCWQIKSMGVKKIKGSNIHPSAAVMWLTHVGTGPLCLSQCSQFQWLNKQNNNFPSLSFFIRCLNSDWLSVLMTLLVILAASLFTNNKTWERMQPFDYSC